MQLPAGRALAYVLVAATVVYSLLLLRTILLKVLFWLLISYMQGGPLFPSPSLDPSVCWFSLTPSLPHLLSTDGHLLTAFAHSIGSIFGFLLCFCPKEFELLVLQSQEVGSLRPSWSSIAF